MPRTSMTSILARVRAAQADLGQDLGGYALSDLIADNFGDLSITECVAIAKQMKLDGVV